MKPLPKIASIVAVNNSQTPVRQFYVERQHLKTMAPPVSLCRAARDSKGVEAVPSGGLLHNHFHNLPGAGPGQQDAQDFQVTTGWNMNLLTSPQSGCIFLVAGSHIVITFFWSQNFVFVFNGESSATAAMRQTFAHLAQHAYRWFASHYIHSHWRP